MAEKYLIAAGGTGALCASAFLYMAAAGCADLNDRYHVLLVDKDKQSDAMTACQNLLSNYNDLRKQMGRVPGTLTFPEVWIHTWNFTEEILDEYYKKTGLNPDYLTDLTLRKLLNSQEDPDVQQLLDTMYSEEELDTNLDKGFYGHPNIGAPVFDYVRDRFLAVAVTCADGTQKKNSFMESLTSTLSKEKAYVYLFGSLFGGTGATVIPNVVLALRTLQKADINLVLGAAVMMPYFRLPVCKDNSWEAMAKVSPADCKFEDQTKEALYYYEESHLLSNMTNLMLIGTSQLDVTSEMYARGGRQTQHFHMVHMLAAISAKRFFSNELGSMKNHITPDIPTTPLGELLVWKITPDSGNHSTLTPKELGIEDEHSQLERFLRFSVVVAYYMALKFSQDSQIVKNTVEVRGTCKQLKDENGNNLGLDWKKLEQNEIGKFYQVPVANAGAICKGFISFLRDVALSGYDWSQYRELNQTEDAEKGPNGKIYYRYELGKVRDDAASRFQDRWVDLANLGCLENLLRDVTPAHVVKNMTLNQISSYEIVGRAPHSMVKYPNSIGTVYEDGTLQKLGLYKGMFHSLKDTVDFCEIYDRLYKEC